MNAGMQLAHKVLVETHPEMVETIRDSIKRHVPRDLIMLSFTFETEYMQQALLNEIEYLEQEISK